MAKKIVFPKTFPLAELTYSQKAVKYGLDNSAPPGAQLNLYELVNTILIPLRNAVKQPIKITSGYRGVALNKKVGGVVTSAHCHGLAVDSICTAFKTPKEWTAFVYKFLTENKIPFDQVIYEHLRSSKWCHIGLRHPDGRQRGQLLTINRKGTFEGIVD